MLAKNEALDPQILLFACLDPVESLPEVALKFSEENWK